MTIIITVSHGICRSYSNRDCDRRAIAAARMLYQVLKARNCEAILHISSYHRSDLDVNVRDARDNPWRVKIRDTITCSKREVGAKDVFVIDMHSFSPDTPAMGYLKLYFMETYVKSKLGPKEYRSWSDADRAWAWLAVTESVGDTNAKIVYGDGHNDIMIDSILNGVGSVILNVNESREILPDIELQEFFEHLTDELLSKFC